jgi:hypothetical protein
MLSLALFATALVLRYLHTAPMPWWLIRSWFNMDKESTIPTWFSSMQFFVVMLVASHCSYRESARPSALWRNGWLPVAGLFLFLSVDEVAMLHEGIQSWVGRRLGPGVVPGVYFNWWVVAFLPAIIASVIYLVVFLGKRFRGRPQLLAIAGMGLLSWLIVLGLELLVGLVSIPSRVKVHVLGWEEFFELAGTTCFLLAFSLYAMTLPPGTRELMHGHSR